jgi:hypothetical protein
MNLLVSDEIKIKILNKLGDGEERTISTLRKEIGAVNYISVKKSCCFLEKIGLIKLDFKNVGTKKFIFIKITDLGKSIVKKIN